MSSLTYEQLIKNYHDNHVLPCTRVFRSMHGATPTELQAVYSWPIPQNAQEVHQFLGFASYYQHCIHCFADTTAHLHALTQQVVTF